MANILVADSGSTKTHWILFENDKKKKPILTPGINPFYQDTKSIVQTISTKLKPKIVTSPDYIYFYGAGCANQKEQIVINALNEVFPQANTFVGSDLLGAARSLCQDNSGIACILGTGSNSCFYDGKDIVSHISPLGYILGDEGSGAVLGKKLISDILKNQLPEIVSQRFFETYKLDVNSILDSAYKQPFPNRYLAQFAKFISDNIDIPELETLVTDSFEEFITRNILQYEQVHSTGIYFTGSVAFHFKKQLENSLAKFDLKASKITEAPLPDLIQYHKKKLEQGESENILVRKLSVTESPSLYDKLENMTVQQLLENINSEDAKVHLAVNKAIPQIQKLVEQVVERMKTGGRLFYIGAGTSGRLGVLDASEVPPTFGVPHTMVIGLIAGGDGALRKAVEGAEDDQEKAWDDLLKYDIGEKDTLVGIAASGTTPYVIGGLKKAREHGILTGCISCNPGSKMSEAAEIPIEVIVGPEFVTGSTRMKAGTAQKMILNMITTSVMIKLGRVKGNKMVNMQLTNKKLIDRGTRMIVEELKIESEEAKQLLLLNGSVKKAIESYRK